MVNKKNGKKMKKSVEIKKNRERIIDEKSREEKRKIVKLETLKKGLICFFNGFDKDKKKDEKLISNDGKGNHFFDVKKCDKTKIYSIKRRVFKERRSLTFNLFLFLILNIYFAFSQNEGGSTYSYVILKVAKGHNKVYSDFGGRTGCSPSFTKPDEIIIKGKQVENEPFQDFIEDENIVKLIWKNNITNCICMFRDCGHIIEMNFSNFDTSQVTIMLDMFRDCKLLKSLDLSIFNTTKVEGKMVNMFWGCNSLEYLNISSFDTSKITSMGHMFSGCFSLKSLDISNFDTKNVEKFDYMFESCYNLTYLNLSNFQTPSAIDLSYMFKNCISLKILDISNFNTTIVSNMKYLFQNCRSISTINLSHFNTINVNNMEGIFKDCSNLISLDLSNFNTINVTNLGNLFINCSKLISLDISNFNTKNVKTLGHTFYNCKSLSSINLSHFITNNTEYLDNMFYGCNNLTVLDLSNFNTSKVKKMENMFNGCNSLTSLDISNFDTSSIIGQDYFKNIFSNCENLMYINLYNYKNGTYHFDENSFRDTVNNLVIYSLNTNLKDELNNNECINVTSEENWYEHRRKITKYEDICTDDCKLTEYQFEYKYKCYENCLNGTYNNNYKCEDCHPDCRECEESNTTISSNCKTCKYENKSLYLGNCIEKCPRDSYYNESINQIICKCELLQCDTCTRESLNQKLCTKCEEGYFPIYDDSYEKNYPYLNCSQSPEGYYLDQGLYKLCYPTCKTCKTAGNATEHNCTECKSKYNNEVNFLDYKNCYILCPDDYDKLIENKSEYVSNCSKDNIYKYEFMNLEKNVMIIVLQAQ